MRNRYKIEYTDVFDSVFYMKYMQKNFKLKTNFGILLSAIKNKIINIV